MARIALLGTGLLGSGIVKHFLKSLNFRLRKIVFGNLLRIDSPVEGFHVHADDTGLRERTGDEAIGMSDVEFERRLARRQKRFPSRIFLKHPESRRQALVQRQATAQECVGCGEVSPVGSEAEPVASDALRR